MTECGKCRNAECRNAECRYAGMFTRGLLFEIELKYCIFDKNFD